MQTDESDEQLPNAERPMRESLDSDSKVTCVRSSQAWKQESHRTSTDEGMRIDESNEQHRTADFSIRESVESDANVTRERCAHEAKHRSQPISTVEGITIDEQSENADAGIREIRHPFSNLTLGANLNRR
jgi:hypothetical protein